MYKDQPKPTASGYCPLWPVTYRCYASTRKRFCNAPDPPLADIASLSFPFRVSPQGFKTRLLGEGFHTLINGGLFSSPTNVATKGGGL